MEAIRIADLTTSTATLGLSLQLHDGTAASS